MVEVTSKINADMFLRYPVFQRGLCDDGTVIMIYGLNWYPYYQFLDLCRSWVDKFIPWINYIIPLTEGLDYSWDAEEYFQDDRYHLNLLSSFLFDVIIAVVWGDSM